MIKTTELLAKQTEDFDLHVVEAFDTIMTRPLRRQPDAMNAFQ